MSRHVIYLREIKLMPTHQLSDAASSSSHVVPRNPRPRSPVKTPRLPLNKICFTPIVEWHQQFGPISQNDPMHQT